jgi:hypothetical protein
MEHISVIYKKNVIVGVVITSEIDLGYIDSKVLVYCEEELENVVKVILGDFKEGVIDVSTLREKLADRLKTHLKIDDIVITLPIPYRSDNKNKTSRDKRLLESLGLKGKYVKVVVNVGTKKDTHIRKRH